MTAPDHAEPRRAPISRRDTINRISEALLPLYDAREARSIALTLLSDLEGVPMQALLADPAAPVRHGDLDGIVARLADGCPVQYVVGSAFFCGRRFAVREGVLIPRPETEELTAWVLESERCARTLLDVGTGSGCIAATLALELPGARIFAADLSEAALAVAAANFRTLGARVTLRRADALHELAERFPERMDAIVSNPPYVPQRDLASLHPNVRDHEPREALFVPDDDPLRFYRAIARAARRMLLPGGRLYFEIYHLFADDMRRMLADEGYTSTEVRCDLFGKPRMVCSRME